MVPNRIWAVMPTYSRPELALKSLACLREQTLPPDGIVLVDNNSPERIGVLASRRFGASITILRLADNKGAAAGFAAGICLAVERGADWLWLMDDDAWPLPTALEDLVTRPEFRVPEIVALCSLKQDPTGHLQKWEALAHGRCLRAPQSEAYELPAFEVDAAAFAGLLVRASAVGRAGLPDARYFGWFSDWEFCLRLRRYGRITCISASRVVHEDDGSRSIRMVRGRTRPTLPLFVRQCLGLRNLTYYFSRHDGWLMSVAQAAYRFCRMTGGILLWDDHKAVRLGMLGRAFLDGLRGRLGPFPIS